MNVGVDIRSTVFFRQEALCIQSIFQELAVSLRVVVGHVHIGGYDVYRDENIVYAQACLHGRQRVEETGPRRRLGVLVGEGHQQSMDQIQASVVHGDKGLIVIIVHDLDDRVVFGDGFLGTMLRQSEVTDDEEIVFVKHKTHRMVQEMAFKVIARCANVRNQRLFAGRIGDGALREINVLDRNVTYVDIVVVRIVSCRNAHSFSFA